MKDVAPSHELTEMELANEWVIEPARRNVSYLPLSSISHQAAGSRACRSYRRPPVLGTDRNVRTVIYGSSILKQMSFATMLSTYKGLAARHESRDPKVHT